MLWSRQKGKKNKIKTAQKGVEKKRNEMGEGKCNTLRRRNTCNTSKEYLKLFGYIYMHNRNNFHPE